MELLVETSVLLYLVDTDHAFPSTGMCLCSNIDEHRHVPGSYIDH